MITLALAVCSLGLGIGVLFEQPIVSVRRFMVAMAAIGATEGPFWTSAIEIGGRVAVVLDRRRGTLPRRFW